MFSKRDHSNLLGYCMVHIIPEELDVNIENYFGFYFS